MNRLIFSILFTFVLFSIPVTYFVFLSVPVGAPTGGYDPSYLKHLKLNKILGELMILGELLVLVAIYFKLQKKI